MVSPRISGTNTPLKVYELLASGVPMLATRIHSHTQVLDDEVCRLAAPEPDAFGAALAGLLGDPVERERLARAAQLRYEERYSRARYESRIRDLLALVLDAQPTGAAVPD